MSPRFGLLQIKLRAPQNYIVPMLDIVLQHLLDIEHFGTALDDGQHHHPIRRLQHAMTIELVQHDFGLGIALAFENDAQTIATRFVADIAQTFYGFVAH